MFVEKEMRNMMKYEDPKIDVISFDVADILTASTGWELPEDTEGFGN